MLKAGGWLRAGALAVLVTALGHGSAHGAIADETHLGGSAGVAAVDRVQVTAADGPTAGASAVGDVDTEAIAFDDYSLGTTITDQYADRGVIFTSDVFVSVDRANPTAPVLSGTPQFFGDIVGQFTVPGTTTPTTVNGFSLDVGYINNRNSVEIEYLDAAGSVIGTTRAQSHGINDIDVFYRGVAGFRVRAVEFERAGFAIDNLVIHRGAVGTRPIRMAQLGDSYSSGEGLIGGDGLRYDCGTDLHEGRYYAGTTLSAWKLFWTGDACQTESGSREKPSGLLRRKRVTYENLCHRHGRAYPNQIRERLGIAAANAIFVACSGAETKHVGAGIGPEAQYPSSPPGVHGGHTQYETVAGFAAAGPPDLITIGIGGNDAGFGDIVVKCIVGSCTEPDFAGRAVSTIAGSVFHNVKTTFETLRSAFGGATIVAFGYPSVIDDPNHWCKGFLSIDAGERAWLKNTVLPAVNETVEEAADEAGVFYVDITSVTAGHGVCSPDEWINGARLGDDSWYRKGNESFHPNQKAHDAIASHFVDHYTDGTGQLLVRNPEPEPPIRPPAGPEIRLGDIDAGAAVKCGAACLQPAACVQSCKIHVEGDGFSPGVTMAAILQSTPLALGNVTADAAGRVDTWLRLPRKAGRGAHSLTLHGFAPDGTRQHAVQRFKVFGRVPARLRARFKPARRGTRVRALTLRRLPPGARVRIACARGGRAVTKALAVGRVKRRGGCPFARRTIRVAKAKGKKGKRRKGRATLRLGRRFKAPLKPRTVVRLEVTRAGVAGRVFDLRVRRGRPPKVVRRCTEPGLADAVRCRRPGAKSKKRRGGGRPGKRRRR